MGWNWKLVRDFNEKWCRANGVPGQWRTAPDPASALVRKMYEEFGEYAEHGDPAELYDLADVLEQAIALAGPDGAENDARLVCLHALTPFGKMAEAITLYAEHRQALYLHCAASALSRDAGRADGDRSAARAHRAKVTEMGGFGALVEWSPVPDGQREFHEEDAVRGASGGAPGHG